VPAEQIARWPGIGLAESALHAPAAGFGGVELYPDLMKPPPVEDTVATIEAVAAGTVRERELAGWLRANLVNLW
jgi:hypothetical protein